MVAEAEQRGAVIAELQAALAERTAWAERMVAEAKQRGAVIAKCQAALGRADGLGPHEGRSVVGGVLNPDRALRRQPGTGRIDCFVPRHGGRFVWS